MKGFWKIVFGSCLGVLLASVLVMVIFFTMIGSAVGGFVDGVTGKENKKEVKLSKESVLLLDIEGEIGDTPSSDLNLEKSFSFANNEQKNFTMQEIIRAIEVARENPKIEAVVLKLEDAKMGFATANEIRVALERFKESGKKVYSFSNNYSYGNYYISSVADELFAGPEGSLSITGLSSTTVFQKGLFDKLGIDMEVYKVGTFKGAVEPLILDKLSDENRLQIQEYLNGLWGGTSSEIAKSRNIDVAVLQKFADEGKFFSYNRVGMADGLIDSLVYKSEIDDVLAQKITGLRDADELRCLRVDQVLQLEKKNSSDDKVAVLYAEGNIVANMDDEDVPPFDSQKYITESLVDKIRDVRDDDDIDAVVLRVNSGGGAVTTSELICREIELLKEKKPVVISMGNMAASGGYYISSHASAIVASPYTLTGSIGIFGILPNFSGTMKKVGLKHETVKTSEMADFPSGIKASTPEQKALVQKNIEEGYQQFLTRVSTGRGMTMEQVDSVGQGRVWLGVKAQELKLVDKLGGLAVAIDEAARLAELGDNYRVVHKVKKVNFFNELFGVDYTATAKYLTMTREERVLMKALKHIKLMSGIQAIPGVDLNRVNMNGNAQIEQEIESTIF